MESFVEKKKKKSTFFETNYDNYQFKFSLDYMHRDSKSETETTPERILTLRI